MLDFLLDRDRWVAIRLLVAGIGPNDAHLNREFDVRHRTVRETFSHVVFPVPFWTAFPTGRPADAGYSAESHPDDRSVAAPTDHDCRASAAFAGVARRLPDEGRLGYAFVDRCGVRESFGCPVPTVAAGFPHAGVPRRPPRPTPGGVRSVV